MSGFEEVSTEALTILQSNLLHGLGIVAGHLKAGTFNKSAKEGSAPPSQSGCLTLILLLDVEDELESRVSGFKRTLDPRLVAK